MEENAIKKNVRVPIYKNGQKTDNLDVNIDSTKEKLANLMNQIILNDEFRKQFDNNPEKILKDAGINLDVTSFEKMKGANKIKVGIGIQVQVEASPQELAEAAVIPLMF